MTRLAILTSGELAEEIVVVQIDGVQVHEELEIRRCLLRFARDPRANCAAELTQPPQSLGGIQHLGGTRQAGLSRPEQGFVAVDALLFPVDDRLVSLRSTGLMR